jgi:hypothetical protein
MEKLYSNSFDFCSQCDSQLIRFENQVTLKKVIFHYAVSTGTSGKVLTKLQRHSILMSTKAEPFVMKCFC